MGRCLAPFALAYLLSPLALKPVELSEPYRLPRWAAGVSWLLDLALQGLGACADRALGGPGQPAHVCSRLAERGSG